MGCDIHLHQEVKIDGVWHHYGNPWIRRNYRMFSKMANVRNDEPGEPYYVEPISEPKGLPDSLSTITLLDLDRWKGDGHSHSWLGIAEIKLLEEWMNGREYPREHDFYGNFQFLFSNGWNLESMPEGVEDIRFVFWFDN